MTKDVEKVPLLLFLNGRNEEASELDKKEPTQLAAHFVFSRGWGSIAAYLRPLSILLLVFVQPPFFPNKTLVD